jgi:hypothetical protein
LPRQFAEKHPGDLEAAALSLDDIVVAEQAFVPERADAPEITGAGRQALAASRGVCRGLSDTTV